MLQILINDYNTYTYAGGGGSRDHIRFTTLVRDSVITRRLEKKIKDEHEMKLKKDADAAADAAKSRSWFG